MDRLAELATFVRIVEEGSLVRAASRLHRSAPAVTRALAALEDWIGQRLVEWDLVQTVSSSTDAKWPLVIRLSSLSQSGQFVTRYFPVGT